MINFDEALAIAMKKIGMTHETSEWVIIEDETIERKYGWFFFYQSREYMETGNFCDLCFLHHLLHHIPLQYRRGRQHP